MEILGTGKWGSGANLMQYSEFNFSPFMLLFFFKFHLEVLILKRNWRWGGQQSKQ